MRAIDAVGEYGERLAERYLVGQGLTVLERRWRCRFGEIDIVAVDRAGSIRGGPAAPSGWTGGPTASNQACRSSTL